MNARERNRQRRDAYRKGTLVRQEKAELKRTLRQMSVWEALYVVADVIEHRGKYEAATPYELIRACRNVGHHRSTQIVNAAGLDTETRLRDIAPSRREAMAFDVRHLAEFRHNAMNGNGGPESDDDFD